MITSSKWKQLAGFVRYNCTLAIHNQLSNTEHLVIPIGTREGYSPREPNTNPDHFINNGITNFDSDQQDLTSVYEGSIAMPETPWQDSTPACSASISSRGQEKMMCHAMQDAVSQHSFCENEGMHYMANKVIPSNPMETETQFIRDH